MKRDTLWKVLLGATVALLCLSLALGQMQPSTANATPQTAGERVAQLYGVFCSVGGQLPDWDKARSYFLKEAVVVLRTTRTTLTTFNLEGFIQDFVNFYVRPFKFGAVSIVPKESGFTEKVVRMKTWEFGDMAHVLVLYEASITGAPMRPEPGIDKLASRPPRRPLADRGRHERTRLRRESDSAGIAINPIGVPP